MSSFDEVYDDSYSQENFQNKTNLGYGDISISNFYSENQNILYNLNSINFDHQSQNEGHDRIKKKIKRIKNENNKPGETKNIPKNLASVLKKFIEKILSNKNDEALRSFSKCRDWIKFKHIPHDNIRKNQIENFLKTPFGKLIGRQFFGNCLWASFFVSENKTNVNLYYKYNLQYFKQTYKTHQKSSKFTKKQ
ncbi:unnamed protein product [Paramecium primaurelia]|uniref:Uncharacterized protein n=1 Tax=Paramecium primaurelia TaxID=5886 RepID=A0A8S1NIZ3_PARPR|nr:unnamed protein product [Paramecium primaurelia]